MRWVAEVGQGLPCAGASPILYGPYRSDARLAALHTTPPTDFDNSVRHPERERSGEASYELPIGSTEELGAALRRNRKALGLTQAELALAAGVGLRFVGEVEAGKPSAQLGRVMQLIEVLGGSLVLRSAPVPPEV